MTIIFIFVMIYFARTLLGHACQKCSNFSCAMNKTPSNIVKAFLDKNTVMKKVWEDTGWTSE